MRTPQEEIRQGGRFAFGENWARFLADLSAERIRTAEQSLRQMLAVESLGGRRFLDVGCGSGLFSLAARRLGARVHSFDYDPQAVACGQELKRRYFPDDPDWTIEPGSALDRDYRGALGVFDVVYAWGVLHHTGAMWEALENMAPLVAGGGRLFLAIYNDQGKASRRWLAVKKAYNRLPPRLRFLVTWPGLVYFWWRPAVKDLLKGRPGRSWAAYKKNRGMSPWRDLVDWVGGYPFEVARPEQIFEFYRDRGFTLTKLKTCGGTLGCNEFVFEKRACLDERP
ncbi:MAG: class I SAM-dependent methyltransferase [Acidobacteriota bacterium]